MTQSSIRFAVESGLARITLNRPEAGNAMDRAFMHEIREVAQRCDGDDAVRAVLLTGSGRMFSVGGDLGWFGQHMDDIGGVIKAAADQLHQAVSTFARMRKPMVVAVNGPAAGAGFSLALLGDYKIAAQSASFTMAYTAAGLSPDGGASYLLPRLVGDARARELMLTNRKLSAEEALAWGMINAVVPDSELAEAAQSMAQRLAAGPTRAFATVKSLLGSSPHVSLETQLQFEADGIAANAASADGLEGIGAFLAKRRPVFQGQ